MLDSFTSFRRQIMVYKQLFNPIKLNLTFSLLILTLIVFLRCFTIQVQAKLDNNGPRGVAKSKAHLYEKKGSTWMCLDGLVTIPYEAINDDYCDCADGSDEPGTSACPNGKFYCANAGHIPSYISSRRVNDGVCEPECCDGSDEYDGKVECPNVCEKVGAEYRKLAEQLAKTRSEGARIKNEVYIQHGKKLKQHHESELERLKILLEASMIKVTERKAALEKAQEKEKAESTAKDHVHIQYKEKIRILREHNERLQDQIDVLLNILGEMKKDHNQNYHDMAVKTAIKGYDEFIEEYEKEMDENIDFEDDEIDEDEIKVESETPHVPITKPSLSEQISDALLGIYNDVLEAIGLSEYVISNPERQLSGVGKSKEVIAAQDAYDKAKEERRKLESEIEEINKKLAKDYGPKQEFAKLDGECFSHDAEEYTYTVCTFGKATQKSNKDHVTTNLGQFEKWIGAESKGDYKYYSSQLYDHGTKCWNGPTRSVKLHLECGTENKILSVSEPEKCEYVMKMTTPAICPENADRNEGKNDHDEL